MGSNTMRLFLIVVSCLFLTVGCFGDPTCEDLHTCEIPKRDAGLEADTASKLNEPVDGRASDSSVGAPDVTMTQDAPTAVTDRDGPLEQDGFDAQDARTQTDVDAADGHADVAIRTDAADGTSQLDGREASATDASPDVGAGCQNSSECSGDAYCSNRACVPRKALGALCSTYDECRTSICGGRCCAAPCTCPQSSAQNLFKNPGFDSDLTAWGTTGIQWSSQDADGCPFSGSANILAANGNPSQCVPVSMGESYDFGGWFRNLDGLIFVCQLQTYPQPDCTGTVGFDMSVGGMEVAWTYKTVRFDVPTGVVSVKVVCEGNANTFVDKLFLSTGGSRF